MFCNECNSLLSDEKDQLVKFIAGHHPKCPAFSIDKELFFTQFHRHVNVSALRLTMQKVAITEEEPKSENPCEKIMKRLYSYLYANYYPIAPNSYIFDWESDILAVNKKSHYITEYEVKVSRGDFKADFFKIDKHNLISDCYTWKFASAIPNYLYYATPVGLLDKSEIPEYAGLIEIGLNVRIAKRAPLLHNKIVTQKTIDSLLKKVYHKYWNIKQ